MGNTALVWLIVTVVLSLSYYRWKRRKVIAMLSRMNGPRSIPFLGHVHLMREFTSGEKVFHTLMRYSSLYKSPVAAEVGPLAYIFVYTPAHIQTVLTSPHCLDKTMQYSFFNVNRAVFGSSGDLWKLQRKLFTPSFGPSILHSFVSIFNEKSFIMVEQLAKFVGKPQRNYYGELVLCFMDIICGTAFGVDANIQRSPLGAEYANLQENYLEFVAIRHYNLSYYPNFIYNMTNTFRKDKKNFDSLMSLLVKATQMDKHESRLNISDIDDLREKNAETKKPQIFIDKLINEIQKDGEIKRDDLKQHLLTICFAGSDTTASTMSALLLMLAMHPEIQERVFQEVMVVCPEKNQIVTMEDAAKLTYTEMVCKETMRMFPVGPMIGRVAKEDIKLDDEITIPANSTVISCIYKVHMDPEIWGPDVKKFNPDNFLPDRTTERHPYAYLPFSGGPRNCLGVRYGWLSMKILLVHILRRYRLRTNLTMDTMMIKFSIFLKIVGGCALILDERIKMWLPLLIPYFCVGVVLVYSCVQWTRRKMYATLASMSGPKPLPVIGNAHKFYNVTAEALADTLRYFGSFPSPVCIHMGPLPHVAIFDPESAQVVLNSQHCLQKTHQYSFFWIPRTLLCAPANVWKVQRKVLNPSFGPAILGSFVPILNEKCITLINLLEQHVGKPQRDFSRDILKCTLDQIYETAFDCKFNMQLSSDGDKSMDLFEGFMELVAARFFTVWKYPDCVYQWTKAYRDQRKYITTYYQTVLEKILKHLDFVNSITKLDKNEDTEKPQNYVNNLLKYLRMQESTSKEEIYSHFGLMVFAGNETTAKTISFILLMLAIHQDVQERCYQEIAGVCPEIDQYISAEHAANLTYLEMACKETMRLFPVAPILGRIATEDVKLNDCHTIPANARIIIGTHQMHRDPKIWGTNADRFDPDNFLPENVAKRHPYSYIPFSGGPRNCLGVRYAWLSMKILIAYVLRNYRLSTSLEYDQVRISYGVMLNIKNGCQLTIEKR
ncbi:cytochrome P450 4c3-like [Armigeres subalbatus]|uniref:cytochrome P450 4c3-like n=1 Tax=Armigeres subalbatus TaxID=124917 RepID=UPI002ED68692